MKLRDVLVGAALAAGLASAAHSTSLLGDEITAAYNYPTLGSPCCSDVNYSSTDFTVGPGIETTMTAGAENAQIDFDFSAHALTITEHGVVDFRTDPAGPTLYNGPVFTDVTGPDFGTVHSVTGLPASDVSIVGNELQINWAGLDTNEGGRIFIDFAGGVPEPATWAMMLLGLGGLGAALRMERRKHALAHAAN